MSDRPFVHLHCHSHYSLLDGASPIPQLVAKAKELGMGALALTDHGNLYGAVEFYTEARSRGIQPIIGYEAYVAPGKRTERDSRGMSEAAYHLTLLARNPAGFRNLIKLASIAFLEGFYYRPRIDKEILAEHADGLVCLSGCASSEFSSLILQDRIDDAAELARWYARTFGEENFYIEIQNNGLEIQRRCAEVAADIARDLGLPLAATSDAHYLCQGDAAAHDVLLCINTGKIRSETNRLRYETNQFYLRSPDEMYQLFPEHDEAVRHTVDIAKRCDLDLDFSARHFPVFHPPAGRTADEHLRELCEAGLRERYGPGPPQEAQDRLRHELDIICRMGFASYFLIVWDFVRFAREKRIPASARGSACGALVSYVLGLSHVDPLRYDLLFERFLDPNRSEAPDIDIDFCQERRDEVLRYVKDRYGEDNVAQIITFGTLAARAAIRDVGRVLNVPLPRVDQIAKMVPQALGITLDEALQQSTDLRREYQADPLVREWIDIARRLEGLVRHASTHAAGVVIADRPLIEYVPLQRPVVAKSGKKRAAAGAGSPDPEYDEPSETAPQELGVLTQWPMDDVAKVGLLKMDFLGLRTLTLLDHTVRLVEQTRGERTDLYNLPLDDPATYALLQQGHTKGVFQLESGGIRDLLQKMRPDSFHDIIATNALYRPGPLGGGMVEAYVNRKHGREKPEYHHPLIEEVLAETYGVMVYQEQVMRILNRLGGIELSQAYSCIKAISKKKQVEVDKYREAFIAGAEERGLTRAKAAEIFGLITHFGGYGFNKSHSTAYALLAFQTAYLKAHYPQEFMAALLSSWAGNTDKLAEQVEDCRRMEVDLLPPDINTGHADFKVGDGKIHYGLAAIKGIGRPAVDCIVAARAERGPFRSLFDFCERVNLQAAGKATIEALIKAGAFDSLGFRRAQLAAVLPQALQTAVGLQEDRRRGQKTLFGAAAQASAEPAVEHLPDIPEWTDNEKLAFEREALGFYITSHPLARHDELLGRHSTHQLSQLPDLQAGQKVVIGGIVGKKIKHTNARPGRSGNTRMAMFDFEDLTGSARCVIFPDDFAKWSSLVVPDQVCFVEAQVDRSREEPNLIVSRLIPLDKAADQLPCRLVVSLRDTLHREDDLDRLGEVLRDFPGRSEVYVEVYSAGRRVLLKTPESVRVSGSASLITRLEEILGTGQARLVPLASNGARNGNGATNGHG